MFIGPPQVHEQLGLLDCVVERVVGVRRLWAECTGDVVLAGPVEPAEVNANRLAWLSGGRISLDDGK